VGYAYRASLLYGVGTFIPMAVHTAALFLLVALGILFVHPQTGLMKVVCSDSPAGALARRLLPLAGLAPVLIGWLWLAGTQRSWLPTGLELPGVILTNAVMFTALLWWQLALLRRSDALRRSAEIELQEKHRALEESARSEREAHHALKQTQSQLVQSEKLAGLGQMVAGIAHEINNPLAFVSNNVAVIQRDLQSLIELIATFRQLADAPEADRAAIKARIGEQIEELDLDYTVSNLPDVLTRSREGLRRIQQIVKDLRDFARLDQSDLQEADLNAGITSTINIIQGTAKKKGFQIQTDLAPLPPVRCHPAKVNQVIMNLLSNAIDASKDGAPVRIESRTEGDLVLIAVCDSGCGIDPAIRDRIFDPFFTTKPIGQGTGLGLSISYGIVKDHGGKLEVQSTPGSGSRFTIRLPVNATRDASRPESAGRDRTAS
ncbi:MAG TPA: ATP-binding protein, partial [Tepidisphaeraceae bacterium]|nr:ATP-binding protein [Tepidisphaeraceae bacterium]